MRVKCLNIGGYKSFATPQKFTFPQGAGLYQVQGENLEEPDLGANGAGKSSFFGALSWLLYGKTERGLRASAVASWFEFMPPSVDAAIEMPDGTEISVSRTWNPNTLTIAEGGDPRPITQGELERIIGYDYEGFLSTVLMGQFNRFFFDLSPAEKLQKFSEALDLSKWMRASDAARHKASNLRAEVDEIEKRLITNQSKAEELVSQVRRLEASKGQWDATSTAEWHRCDDRLRGLNNELEELEGVVAKTREKLSTLDSYEAEDKKDLLKADKKIASFQKKLNEYQHALRQYRREIDEHQKAAKGTDGMTTCPVCFRETNSDTLRSIVQQYESMVGITEALMNQSQAHVDELSKKCSKWEKHRGEIRESLEAAAAKREKIEKTYRDAQVKIAVLKNESSELKKRIDALINAENPYVADLRETNKRLKEIRALITKDTTRLSLAKKDHVCTHAWVAGFKELRLWLVEQALAELEILVNNSLVELGLHGWTVRCEAEKENASGGVSKGFHVLIKSPKSPDLVPWEAWSGGETQRLRIAGACGLSDLICSSRGLDPKIEIWDEPTAHVNEDFIDDLMHFFSTRAMKLDRQLWLIDHRSITYGGFSGTLKITKGKNGSQIEYR